LTRGLSGGNLDGGDSDVGGGIEVLLEHTAVVHFVDVVAGEDEGEFGALAADGIDVLVYGIGGALIPLLRDAHLGRQNFDVITQAGEWGPPGADMAVQAQGFVLGEHEDTAQIRVDAIRKRDVNDAVESAERNGGLGAVASERPQTLALASGKEYSDGIPHV
jgi:hypothetical protein